MSSTNKSIRSFFKPVQMASKQEGPAIAPVPKAPLRQTNQLPRTPISYSLEENSFKTRTDSPEPRTSPYTSSLSPPPSTPDSPSLEARMSVPKTKSFRADHVVRGSDEDDSDSSLEDLIFPTNLPPARAPQPRLSSGFAPRTPTINRHVNFLSSPLTVLPKNNLDLNTLIGYARDNDAAEVSSKKIKAIMAAENENEHKYHPKAKDGEIFDRTALLHSVVGGQENGGASKVTRALKRTEAAITEKRWYFFNTQPVHLKSERVAFPKAAIPKEWEQELKDPRIRQQSFLTGFVGTMIQSGTGLPDELVLWILNDACLETFDPLRTSYFNTLQTTPEQLEELLLPDLIYSLFQKLGAVGPGSNINQKILPVSALTQPYLGRDWSRLRSLVKFLGSVADSLQQQSRVFLICMMLRLAVDHVVPDNVDLFVVVQKTLDRLCRYTPEDCWQSCCHEVCKNVFQNVELPTFRLQMVETIPSATYRSHDLRRRLAMCFYFNDLSYSERHPDETVDLNKFTLRLNSPDFVVTPKTDYPELTALILLLNIAVDDGRSSKLDLSNKATKQKYNKSVDDLVSRIKDIMSKIGHPGAAFISRIEAKQAIELVSQMIADTVRTETKPKEHLFDRNRGRDPEDLEQEKASMSKFLAKVNGKGSTEQKPTR